MFTRGVIREPKGVDSMRFVLIVLDSVGIGEAPDSYKFGDVGVNTIVHVAEAKGGLYMPNMQRLGLGSIERIEGVEPLENPHGCYGKMQEASAGKDTTSGHWEMAGVIVSKPFPVYPNGFPREIISEFERKIGRKVLGNKPASGTVIIQELGEEHMRTGYPIVYTSADSVFQIAAHEDIIPVEELYRMCEVARSILRGEHAVGRVIARPFIGSPGNFRRTEKRRDFSLLPIQPTVLDYLKEAGYDLCGVGKIEDIFAHRGLTRSVHSGSNAEGIDAIKSFLEEHWEGLLFANLIDFDMLYGHRNDPIGYGNALEYFDRRLREIMELMDEDDVLVITADHGCDPTTPGTDHTREYVPLIVAGNRIRKGVNLGVRRSYADVAKTIDEAFSLNKVRVGESFWKNIKW